MITYDEVNSKAVRFSFSKDGTEVARAYLYIIRNDLSKRPYGLLEDVWVDDNLQEEGVSNNLVQGVIDKAKEEGCYKIIATSRLEKIKIHRFYLDMGFALHGYELRMEF